MRTSIFLFIVNLIFCRVLQASIPCTCTLGDNLRRAAGEVDNQMCRRADRDTAPVKSLSPTLQNTYTKHYNTVCVHNLVVSFSESYNAEFLLNKTVARYTFK